MGWQSVQALIVAVYSCYLAAVYSFREPFFLYPVLALLLTVVWETMWWAGAPSFAAIAVTLGVFVIALSFRKRRRQLLLTNEPSSPGAALAFALIGFAVAFFAGIVIGVLS